MQYSLNIPVLICQCKLQGAEGGRERAVDPMGQVSFNNRMVPVIGQCNWSPGLMSDREMVQAFTLSFIYA